MTTSYEHLKKAVVENEDIYKTSMSALKSIHGAGRLGVHVRDAISRSLESHGLGHIPRELPAYQEEPVRVYLLGSPIADVIKAVLDPSDKGDDTLRSIGSSEAQEQLRQIRQIVCG